MPDLSHIYPETLEYFDHDELRSRVFTDKYAYRDENGNQLETTPHQLWARIAREIASAEPTAELRQEWEEKFNWLLGDFRFIPGGRIMFGAGQKVRATLLNCYVIPIKDDSIEGIFDWCKEAAKTYSFGGGVGVDIGLLRPKGAPVNNSARYSTGAVSFMELFSTTTGTIGQSGRRGALMITIPVDHPDIEEFIEIKRNLDKVRYANISVRLTDEFMQAVENDQDFELKWKEERDYPRRKVNARELWDKIVSAAHQSAEPGLIFWDTMRNNSSNEYGKMKIVSTNPCSEIPLEPYGCCCLGNVNLANFINDAFGDNPEVDWENLETALQYAVRFLDNVLDYNAEKHAVEEQKTASLYSRRIGVGFTGLGDMLVKLKIRYDTSEALEFVDSLFERIKNTIYTYSIELGQEKGVFPGFEAKEHLSQGFIQKLKPEIRAEIEKKGIRNGGIITVPPVGSGGILAGTTSGVEPIFAFSYKRFSESLTQKDFRVYHPLVARYMQENGIESEADLPDYFVSAHEISPKFRVDMQATLQKHIDHSISSTVNLPTDTTVETVKEIYMRAWKSGCKGITVYREGSREGILSTAKDKEEVATDTDAKQDLVNKKLGRERILIGKTIKMKLLHETMYLTVNTNGGGRIREVFVNIGKSGGDEKADSEAVGRLISLYLQHGGDLNDVIKSLKGIKGRNISFDGDKKLFSVPDAIAKGLEALSGEKIQVERRLSVCPDCDEEALIFENGCYLCTACAYTKCG
jgi:ribonucleoside-diphosphate reductase alpha chain